MPTDPTTTAACRCPDCGSLDVSSVGGGVDRCASCGTTWPHATAALVTHDHGTRTGWFADLTDGGRNPKWPWQPFIQTAGGCFPLPISFETEDACVEFIRQNVLGRGMLDDIR